MICSLAGEECVVTPRCVWQSETEHRPGSSAWSSQLLGTVSPGSSSCLCMMRFCPPAGNEKTDYQHFVLLMKLPLLLSTWSLCAMVIPEIWELCAMKEHLFPFPSSSLWLFGNWRMEGVKCCGLQFQFSRRQNYSLCIFLPAVLVFTIILLSAFSICTSVIQREWGSTDPIALLVFWVYF